MHNAPKFSAVNAPSAGSLRHSVYPSSAPNATSAGTSAMPKIRHRKRRSTDHSAAGRRPRNHAAMNAAGIVAPSIDPAASASQGVSTNSNSPIALTDGLKN